MHVREGACTHCCISYTRADSCTITHQMRRWMPSNASPCLTPASSKKNQKHTSSFLRTNIIFMTSWCRCMLICWIVACVCVSLAASVRQPSALWELLSGTRLACCTSRKARGEVGDLFIWGGKGRVALCCSPKHMGG